MSLSDFLQRNQSVGYKEEEKKQFAVLSKKSCSRLQQKLRLAPFEIRRNEGGIAVSGETTLHGMRRDGVGIYIQFTCDGFSENAALVRMVTSMKDFTGAANQYIRPGPQFEERIAELAERLMQR